MRSSGRRGRASVPIAQQHEFARGASDSIRTQALELADAVIHGGTT